MVTIASIDASVTALKFMQANWLLVIVEGNQNLETPLSVLQYQVYMENLPTLQQRRMLIWHQMKNFLTLIKSIELELRTKYAGRNLMFDRQSVKPVSFG